MPVQTQIQVRRGTASSWTSTNPTLAAGEIGFETDTGKIKVGNGSSTWSALNYVGAANAIQYVYNATAGQTSFSGADSNGLTLSYTVGAEQVYVNGVLQVRTSDYTATNGTSVTLTTATIASDVVTIVAFGTFDIANTYTQAQANATFPLNTSSFFAGKNKIINGDFRINQRAFSSTTTSGTYGFDRWVYYYTSGTTTYSAQTFTLGTAPVSGYEGTNFARVLTSGQTGTNANAIFRQPIESVRTFAGQTVTVSFWAKAASGTPKIAVELGQSFGTGGSPSTEVNTYAGQATLSTSWSRYSLSIAIPSISGKTIGTNNNDALLLTLWTSAGSDFNSRTGSLGIQNATIDIWGVQVEAGSVATAFQTATGTIQGELAACQRYYYRITASTTGTWYPTTAIAEGTTSLVSQTVFPVTMRVVPTSVDYTNLRVTDTINAQNLTAVTISGNSSTQQATCAFTVASGLTQYRPYFVQNSGNATSYLGFSAEL